MSFWLILGGGFILYLVIKAMKQPSEKKEQNSRSVDKTKYNQSPANIRAASVRDFDDEEEGDGFATFTISYGRQEPKSKNKSAGRWMPANESVTINGDVVTKGNFYFGGKLSSLDGYGTEASLVDNSLAIVKKPVNYEDESLGYWPKYNSISKGCRGAYLSWLASGRDDPQAPTGYVFIYFYGLERRILVDSVKNQVGDSEFTCLFEEIVRLKNIYGGNRSFLNYSTHLLEIMCLLRPSVVSDPDLEKNPKQDSLLVKYRIAKVVNEGEPISASLALAWLKIIPTYNMRKPARRCAYEFGQLFCRRYAKIYENGIVVKPNKTRLKIEYWPASSSLRGVKIPHENLPDPINLKTPTSKLIKLAEECTEALDGYSRYLGKEDTSRTDIAALLLLPDDLSDIGETLGLGKFKRWAENCIVKDDGIVEFNELWQFTRNSLPVKVGKRETDFIQAMVDKSGFGLAPDARYHQAKPSQDGKLVLFRNGHGKAFNPSDSFNEVGMILRLGVVVATIDSHVHESEVHLLRTLIDSDSRLSKIEKDSMNAYLTWRLNSSPNISGLKAALENLSKKAKALVSKVLIRVALADGKIDTVEIKQLEKLYVLLGLDKKLLSGDIHTLRTEVISPNIEAASIINLGPKAHSNEFLLDEGILAVHESQTEDVRSLLSAIFVDEAPEEELPPESERVEEEEIGLDATYYGLYEILISKNMWSLSEVDEQCKKMGLMASGAIEAINEWAFEKTGQSVLEESSDYIYIDQEIAEELEG